MYLSVGKWKLCYWCFTVNAGEHYCNAPWQKADAIAGEGLEYASDHMLNQVAAFHVESAEAMRAEMLKLRAGAELDDDQGETTDG